MKHTFVRIASRLAFILSLCALPRLHAADLPIYHYQGEVSGIVCSVCAGNVKHALEKLPGVQEVKIVADKAGGTPRLTILSTSPALTRDLAVKALGKSAESYDIRRLDKTAAR